MCCYKQEVQSLIINNSFSQVFVGRYVTLWVSEKSWVYTLFQQKYVRNIRKGDNLFLVEAINALFNGSALNLLI